MRTVAATSGLHNLHLFSLLQSSMAKSLRSKTKRAFRAKKREEGVYAAAHAARLDRLHAKIEAIVAAPRPVRDENLEDVENVEGEEDIPEDEMAGGWQFVLFFMVMAVLTLFQLTTAFCFQMISHRKPGVNLVMRLRFRGRFWR